MSLPRDGLRPVPEETARVAHAAFPDGTIYLWLRDELGALFDDALFTAVYAREGQPALHPWRLALASGPGVWPWRLALASGPGVWPWRLALVSTMQFMENLSDRQAAQAVRARIDWMEICAGSGVERRRL